MRPNKAPCRRSWARAAEVKHQPAEGSPNAPFAQREAAFIAAKENRAQRLDAATPLGPAKHGMGSAGLSALPPITMKLPASTLDVWLPEDQLSGS